MNKKLVILGISAVLMLVTISFASALNTNPANIEKKESPLYGIRTKLAIKEKIGQIFENIKAKFLGEKIFFIPYKFLRILGNDNNIDSIDPFPITCPLTICCGKIK